MGKTLKESVEIYINKGISSGDEPSTVENKTNLFNRLLSWLGDRDFDLNTAENYIAYLRKKKYTNESIRTEVANIKALVKFMFKRGHIPINWAEDLVKPKAKRPKFEPPTREITIKAIIAGTEPKKFKPGVSGDNSRNAYIKSETRLALLFALDTGLRPSEVFRLKGSDLIFNIPCPKFRIPPSKGHMDELGIIPPQLIGELKKRAHRSRLFEATNATGNDALQRGFKELGEELTFTITMHKLRHFFASYLIKAGVHIDTVKQILRHTDIQTTIDNYIHYYDSEIINAIYKTIPEARATMPLEEKLKYYEEVFNSLGIDKDKTLDFKVDRSEGELKIIIKEKEQYPTVATL